MKQISRVVWAASLSLLMIFSSFVALGGRSSVDADSAPAEGLDSIIPGPSPLVTFNPWVNFTGTTVYHSIPEMEAEIFQIAEDHPDIVKLTSIGKSLQGRDIWAMKISDNPYVEEASEPEVYFNSNHHAREWMTIEIALYSMNYLTDLYGSDPTVTSIVNNRQVWIIPTVNPDGRNYDSTGDNPASHSVQPYGWRRNLRDNDNSGTFNPPNDGVDLNRNYGYLWGASGATSDTTYDTYGGPYPFSEPETAAVRDFCRQHNFVFAISYHTSSQLILYPWGWTYEDAPDNDALVAVGAQMRSVITNTAGSDQAQYTLQKSSGLYPTAGSDDDWLYGELGVFAYCIEAYPSPADVSSSDPAVTGSYDQFHPREDKVVPVCQDNIPALLLLCQAASNKFQFIDHVAVSPDTAELTINKGASRTAYLNVTDDGRRADSFTITRTVPSGWTLNLNPASMSLARNETRQATLGITVPAGAASGTYKIWVNATSTTNSSCRDSTLITVVVPYPDDVTAFELSPFTELGDFPKGQYRIDGTVKNVGEVSVPAFNSQLTIKQLGVGSAVTLFTDNIESALNTKWTIIDHDLTHSASVWQRSTAQKHAGTYSAWCGSGSAYTASTIQSLQMTQPISLERYNSATLQFWSYYNTEQYYDFLMVEGSPDNGHSWNYITRYDGVATSWQLRTLDLGDYLGAEQFTLRFRFTSDDYTDYAGFYLDDVTITANDPTQTIIYGPAQLPTSGPLAVGQSQTLAWNYNFNTAGTYLASLQTLYGTDGNAGNNLKDVMFYINGSRNLPEFGGITSVSNTGMDDVLDLTWDPALQINSPLTYKVYRFDHAPTLAEVNAATPVWSGSSVSYSDPGLTRGQTYYYVVRAQDSMGQAEANIVTMSGTPGITVERWGAAGTSTTEIRYMRQDNVLGTSQSATAAQTASFGDGGTVYAGIRVWKRSSLGVDTEITAGSAVAIASTNVNGEGLFTGAWTPPMTALSDSDSIVVRVYAALTTPPATQRAEFVSEQLGATQLDNNAWSVSYYLIRSSTGAGNDRFCWGTTTYNSRIEGFKWTVAGNPLDHNTVNWSASGPDITQFNVYRSDLQTGPWDSAHLVTTVPADTFTFMDLNRGAADSTYWWYVVRGMDGYGTEETNTNAVQEPGAGAPYSISLAGKTAGSWVLVSFPHSVSGAIQTVLNDAALGDGQTTWDVARWYNPATPSDPWKTYRVGGSANDLTTIDNKVGLWLHLTANSGDQALTLGVSGAYPASGVVINLAAGWNLVGYPSATSKLVSVALTGTGADRVAYWQANSPYITDTSNLASVTMTDGNAYWVHVPAPTAWTVNP